MKVFFIILCVVSFTATIFMLAKYGIKKKENQEYITPEKIYSGNDDK